MSRILYSTAIYIYGALIRIAALFHPKARAFIRGRKNWTSELKELTGNNDDWIWIHCSSLGEFEQGRPVIEKIKKEHPGQAILLSFFSPSGYEVKKDYEHADAVVYMPLDTARNARRFVNIVKPRATLFIKYEFWYHHLRHLHKAGIPIYLISASFRKSQIFFRWYGGFFRRMLTFYDTIFVQDNRSAKLLSGINTDTRISGDTRFDRVWEITHENWPGNDVRYFAEQAGKVLVAGSTWLPDEEIIENNLEHFPDMKLILAPHETDQTRIVKIQDIFRNHQLCCLSASDPENLKNCRILIVDSIGHLAKIYRYADFAYIGGGFGKGIHNTLEAACYGLPVIFGPNHQRFNEAGELIRNNAAFSINSAEDLHATLEKLYVQKKRKTAGENARNYVKNNLGASEKILRTLEKSDVFSSQI